MVWITLPGIQTIMVEFPDVMRGATIVTVLERAAALLRARAIEEHELYLLQRLVIRRRFQPRLGFIEGTCRSRVGTWYSQLGWNLDGV